MRRNSTHLAVLVVLTLLLVGVVTSRQTVAQAPAGGGVIALANGRVIDGTGRPVVERATKQVLVQAKKISRLRYCRRLGLRLT